MNRITYASTASSIALVTTLGGAMYVGRVTGADVKDESLTGRDVRNGSLAEKEFRIPVLAERDLYLDGAQRTEPVVVSVDEGFTTLVRMPLDLTKNSDLLVRGTVGFTNDGQKPTTVTYRVLLDGKTHHDFTLVDVADAGEGGLSPVSFLCDAVPAGEHDVQLQARVEPDPTGAVTFGNRELELAGFRLPPSIP
jgi:hypothetical protein